MTIVEAAEMEWALRETLGPSNKPKTEFVRPNESQCANLLLQGKFEQVLSLFPSVTNASDQDSLNKRLLELQQDLAGQLKAASLAVAALQLFVQLNWTGFSLKTSSIHLPPSLSLDLDGESVSTNAKLPGLLALAKLIFSLSPLKKNWTIQAWHLRSLIIHQKILSDRSDSLHAQAKELISQLINLNISVPLRMEMGLFLFHFFDAKALEDALDESCRELGFKFEETGALGKRTKFQIRDLAQLTLDMTTTKIDSDCDTLSSLLPVDVRLEDEVRLDKIKFSSNPKDDPDLGLLEQNILLAAFVAKKRYLPKDELSHEQLMPYLEPVLRSRPTAWALQMSALLSRSELESSSRRTVERSMMQLESLVDSIRDGDDNHVNRLNLIYSVPLPPFWQVEQILCQALQSLGSIKAALDIALRLDLWEDMIRCYHLLQLRHKAAEVIRTRLSLEETPLLCCMMGDATDEIEWYHRALELSGQRSARAFRSLGDHFYFKKDYSEAIGFFERSLELNPYQLQTLLRLGYAASMQERWELTAKTYRKYCSYESDNFEAWNNLSRAYIKLGEKSRAWKVLQEAVKCDYDNWKIWDNVMVVSTDCAHFEEVIRAYNRILDLKEKHVDLEVLSILTRAIVTDVKDNFDRPSGQLRPAALKLLGRLTSQVPGESGLWQLYSELVALEPSSPESWVRRCQYLQRAFTCYSQRNLGWQADVGKCKHVLDLGLKYGQGVLANEGQDNPQASTLLSSAKMNLKGAIRLIQREQESIQSGDIQDDIREDFLALQGILQEIEQSLSGFT